MCIYIYIYTHTHIYTHICIYVCVCERNLPFVWQISCLNILLSLDNLSFDFVYKFLPEIFNV